MPAFIPIDDGYTREGYVAEAPEMYEAVAFTYRPLTKRQSTRMLAEIGSASGNSPVDRAEAGEAKAAEWLARHLKTWDVKNAVHAVEITAENVQQLHPVLFGRLFDVVTGFKPSDRKPVDEAAEAKN